MGISLKRLERKKLEVGLNRLGQFGIDVERWLAMLDADDATMQSLVSAWPVSATSNAYAYDAVGLLGFGTPHEEPLPEAKSGEIVIRYGGWSLRELCDNAIVREKNLMLEQDWYHSYEWSSEKLPAGIYRLRIPVPNSNLNTFAEQAHMLSSGEQTAPVVLVATAMLVHRLQTGENLLGKGQTYCKEIIRHYCFGYGTTRHRVGLGWTDAGLMVFDTFHSGYTSLWLSSVRTSES